MKMSKIAGVDQPRSTRTAQRTTRRWQVAIFGSILLAFTMLAQAQVREFDQPDSIETPWSVVSTAPYLPDPSFNMGQYFDDYFGGINSAYMGRKIARLPNGDVIVAGLVPTFPQHYSPLLINLGLARYDANGTWVSWTNPGIYGTFNNWHIHFPDNGDPTNPQNVKDVLDIQVVGNRIFVLVDHKFEGTADTDVVIHVFGTDGAFIGSTIVLGTAMDEYAGSMAFRSSLTLPETITVGVVASTFNGVWRPTYRSGTVNADSTITLNPIVYPNPGNYCPTNRGCILRGIAVGGRATSGAATKFYLAGARQANIPDNNNWDFLAMAVNFDGTPVALFGGNGVTTVPFFEGGNNYNDANSIQVKTTGLIGTIHDEIYVSGFVDRQCKDGFGIAKLNENGALDNTFGKVVGGGRSGKMVVGGAIPPINGSCSDLLPFSTSNTYANDSALADGKLAIAGFTSKFNFPACIVGQPCHEEDVDGMVAIIDTAQGDIDSFRTYPYTDTVNGPRTRHSGLSGIVESGGGTFTATGTGRYFETATYPSKTQFVTLRVRSDGIFANGFD